MNMAKNKLNKRTGVLLMPLIYIIGTIIALIAKISIKDIMLDFQYNVLIILIVMELFTNLVSSTGIMEFLSLKLSILSKGNKKTILVLFGLLMFFISAFLNNITAVLIILPVIFVLLKTIGVDQKYVNIFFAVILALSNTGGASSPIGDFPAIVIMSSGITTFVGYLIRAFPLFLLTSIIIICCYCLMIKEEVYKTEFKELSLDLLHSKYKNLTINKGPLCCLIIIFILMFVGWSTIPQKVIPPEIIALLGYVSALLVLERQEIKIVNLIDIKPVLTIGAFLFLSAVISKTGILDVIAYYLQINIQNPKLLLIVIMIITSLVSGIFGAGAASSAMLPIIINLCNNFFTSQTDWIAIAYAAAICAGSSLFLWSATAGIILSKRINGTCLTAENKTIKWNIIEYFKYGILNYVIQIVVAIIIIFLII